ncbi:hypothetical protein [Caballeronia arationis]|nr:hypothetical protein [Caballeronia arationis]
MMRLEFMLLSPDLGYEGFYYFLISDASNCGDSDICRLIFYCYYLMLGLNRYDTPTRGSTDSVLGLDALAEKDDHPPTLRWPTCFKACVQRIRAIFDPKECLN